MKLRYGILLVLLLVPDISFSQASKIRLSVTHTGSDSVGQAIAYALKEAIRGSQSFVLFEHDYRNPAILIRLLSVDGSPGEKGQVSAVAVIIAYDSVEMPGKGILLHYLVHSCGRNKTEACAKEILPDIDLIVEKLRRDSPDLWQNIRVN